MFSTSTLRSYFVLALALVLALPLALLLIAGKAGTPEDALAAREAVIRYQLTNSEPGLADGVDIFCVEIVEVADTAVSPRSDPPQELIQRLNDGRHKVRKGSDCDYNRGNGVVVKGSNNPGLVLRVEGVSWKSDTSVAITGGYYRSSEGSSGHVYHLEKRGGKWLVIEDRLLWLS
ncbi:hypothetical protein [Massilia sp. SYSU DXS3249]